jgi:hypothetical protein
VEIRFGFTFLVYLGSCIQNVYQVRELLCFFHPWQKTIVTKLLRTNRSRWRKNPALSSYRSRKSARTQLRQPHSSDQRRSLCSLQVAVPGLLPNPAARSVRSPSERLRLSHHSRLPTRSFPEAYRARRVLNDGGKY